MAHHQRLNPSGLFDAAPLGYHQLQISTGTRLIHIAGQAALDATATPVAPGDFAGQMAMCFHNLRIALAAAGATPADVCSLRVYVLTSVLDEVPLLSAALKDTFGAAGTPPATLVGVAALAMPDLLIEIEATAIT